MEVQEEPLLRLSLIVKLGVVREIGENYDGEYEHFSGGGG